MSKESRTTYPLSGDFISEDAVHGALGQWRQTPQATPTDEVNAPLRRWSVAELVARAVAPRPADGMCR